MPTVSGFIEAVSKKSVGAGTSWGPKDTTSFMMDTVWYSGGFKHYTIDKGDEVELTFDVNAKGYNDIQAIKVLSRGAGSAPTANTGVPKMGRTFPIDALAPERTINRQNALTAAVNLVISDKVTLAKGQSLSETVIMFARDFEAYTTGDLDMEEAKEMVNAA